MSTPEIDALVTKYLPLARRLAASRNSRTPHSVRREDLESAALDGLWEAARRYEAERGTPFEKWASQIIRVRILDFMRENDSLSRLERARTKQLAKVKRELTQTLGRVPTQDELAERTGLSLYILGSRDDDRQREISLQHLLYENDHGTRFMLLEDTIAAEERDDGEETFRELTRGLSDRSQAILWLYYWEDLSMAEIAKQMGVSESRISQAMAVIREQLRRRLSRQSA